MKCDTDIEQVALFSTHIQTGKNLIHSSVQNKKYSAIFHKR